MANQEHLAILEKGVEAWNAWLKANFGIRLDLGGAELCCVRLGDAYLGGADLNSAKLRFADLSSVHLGKADLSGADLSNAILRDATLRGADLRYACLGSADLDHADLSNAYLSGAYLHGANVPGTVLRGADLRGADLSGLSLRGVDLTNTCLGGADLSGADLSEGHLRRAILNGAHLSGANLSDADLRSASLSGADLRGAGLTNANLTNANLSGADLGGATVRGADFAEAFVEYTAFGNVDLSAAKNLVSVRHLGPSIIGLDTIYRSKGHIPESFLRGAGVPENFITYMNSLTGAAFDFYSCFISYSTKDQAFGDRLYADLQARGVRCWLASEDLKIGDKFRARIDESIRVHDKLLLVLSADSIRSQWVETEVETAFERERREKRTILFPIRLDDAVMETEEAWAADIRRTRHIGNFTAWENHNSYQRVLERLFRDLAAAPDAKAANK